MACPCFHPLRRRLGGDTALRPLGDLWEGTCHADPKRPFSPDHTATYRLCNVGYARGACPHWPPGNGPDAVRFTIRSHAGSLVQLYYVAERDHLPFAHGPLEFDTVRGAWIGTPASKLLERQAYAYLASYLRRKAEALGA